MAYTFIIPLLFTLVLQGVTATPAERREAYVPTIQSSGARLRLLTKHSQTTLRILAYVKRCGVLFTVLAIQLLPTILSTLFNHPTVLRRQLHVCFRIPFSSFGIPIVRHFILWTNRIRWIR